LVVPVPSLAVSGVRLSFMVPLAGESPLADARLRLTPMVTCCSLALAPYTHPWFTLSLPAPPVGIHAHILASMLADKLAISSVHTLVGNLHPTLPS